MATTSPQLIWQVLKKGSAFFVKGRSGDRPIFSSEPGNLAAKHSYKHSGLANANTVDLAFAEGGIKVTTSRAKNASKPAASKASSVSKKGARRAAAAAGKVAASSRPDLKRAAAARASAIARAQRSLKAAAKATA